jgi:hypothetical protein
VVIGDLSVLASCAYAATPIDRPFIVLAETKPIFALVASNRTRKGAS